MSVPPVRTSAAKVAANITAGETVESCQPIHLSVQGGASPYIITIAALNYPTVQNMTLASSDETLIFYNNIPSSGSQFIGEETLYYLYL